MPSQPAPLVKADLSRVRAVFTDVDGTLTTRGRLQATTLRAVEWLVAHRLDVVLVSGRPAGWGECWARQLPVAGVVVENGGLYFARRPDGSVKKVYAQAARVRARNRPRLLREVAAVMRAVRGSKLSMDSQATEVDVAIDYAEDARLGQEAAGRLEALLAARGVSAVRSSVHVNAWLGDFDKRTTVRRFLRQEWGTTLEADDRRFVYVGDSFNDQPLFGAFALSIGVANVLELDLAVPPRFVTRAREGQGFGEIADAIIRQRRGRRRG